MNSRLQFELFIKALRDRAFQACPIQAALVATRAADNADVGSVRLSRIEAAMKETRADRVGE